MTAMALAKDMVDSIELRLRDGRVFTIPGPQVESFELEMTLTDVGRKMAHRYLFTLRAWAVQVNMSVADDIEESPVLGLNNGPKRIAGA